MSIRWQLNLMGVVNILWVCPVGVAMVPDGNPKKLEPTMYVFSKASCLQYCSNWGPLQLLKCWVSLQCQLSFSLLSLPESLSKKKCSCSLQQKLDHVYFSKPHGIILNGFPEFWTLFLMSIGVNRPPLRGTVPLLEVLSPCQNVPL